MSAIRTFFESDGGRKMTTSELMALTQGEREELARLCAKELGVELKAEAEAAKK